MSQRRQWRGETPKKQYLQRSRDWWTGISQLGIMDLQHKCQESIYLLFKAEAVWVLRQILSKESMAQSVISLITCYNWNCVLHGFKIQHSEIWAFSSHVIRNASHTHYNTALKIRNTASLYRALLFITWNEFAVGFECFGHWGEKGLIFTSYTITIEAGYTNVLLICCCCFCFDELSRNSDTKPMTWSTFHVLNILCRVSGTRIHISADRNHSYKEKRKKEIWCLLVWKNRCFNAENNG